MTALHNNRDEVQEAIEEARKHSYEVITGHRYVIEATDKMDAMHKAGQKFTEQHGEPEDNSLTNGTFTHLLEIDRQAVYMPIPDGLGLGEARQLLDWAMKNADRAHVNWLELTEQIEQASEYETVRHNLDGISADLFTEWAEDNIGITYAYEVTAETLEELARDCAERYLGEHRWSSEFAREYYEDSGELASTPLEILDAVDWEQVWEDALSHDIQEVYHKGDYHFFRNY